MMSTTIPLRTSQRFVNWFSICYFACAVAMLVYLWSKIPVFSEIGTSLLDFAFNLMYVVIGALLWPGTLLALLVCGW